MENELCQICLQPKKASASGSITQWIASCTCRELTSEEELFASLKICKSCNKRVSIARHGSFTQWILRSDLCSCGIPEVAPERKLESENSQTPETFKVEYPRLENIDVDFPYSRYQPIEEIGRGASGVVFRANDKLLNRVVAVKVLHHLADDLIVAFQEEARITSKLNHPNIIDIIDINTTDSGTPYMVLEYVAGVSLREFIKTDGPMESFEAVDLFIQIGEALSAAHENGVFHRDLQPANILLKKGEGSLPVSKIIDFGIATLSKQQTESAEGQKLAGTPPYMSPDQAGGHEFDQRSDIYSFGCVMFETLTGQPPFTGETALEILNKQLREKPPSMQKLSTVEVPEKLELIIQKCLQPQKEDRYQSTLDIVDALKNSLEVEETVIQKADEEKRGSSKNLMYTAMTFTLLVGITVSYFYLSLKNEIIPDKPYKEDPDIINGAVIRSSEDLGGFEPMYNNPEFFQAKQFTEDASLKKLVGREDIKMLSLRNTFVEGPGLVHLTKLPLTLVDLDHTKITDKYILPLAEIPTLNYLVLARTQMTGANLDKFKNIERLNVVSSKFNDEGAKQISTLDKLKSLELSGENLTEAGWRYLESCPKLEFINIVGNHIKSRKLNELSKFKQLKRLAFGDREISSDDIKVVSRLNLDSFEIWKDCSFINDAKKSLKSMKNTKSITLQSTHFGEDEIQELKKALPACKIKLLVLPDEQSAKKEVKVIKLSDNLGAFSEYKDRPGFVEAGRLVEDENLKLLSDRKDIDKLLLSHSMIDGSGLKYLTKLPLVSIGISDTYIDDKALEPLSEIPTLKVMQVDRTKVKGRNLEKFKNLENLMIQKSSLDDKGVESLCKLEKLKLITLSGEHLSKEGWLYLAKNCPVERFILIGNHLQSSRLEIFALFKNLKSLSLSERKISENDIKALEKLNLEELSLFATSSISKSAKQSLARLKNVGQLRVSANLLSEKEIEELKKSLGNVYIRKGPARIEKRKSRVIPADLTK